MAHGVASALIVIDPKNKIATTYLQQTQGATGGAILPLTSKIIQESTAPLNDKSLGEGYTSLKLEAKLLHEELEGVLKLGAISLEDEDVISNLKAIRDGHINMAVSISRPPPVREIARSITRVPNNSENLITEDFEAFVRWAGYQNPPLGGDTIREQLVKRKELLEATLPESMKRHSIAALANIERNFLQKKYVNSETMYGDRIEDIPKANFFVSEDNYAWDMEELAQAITSNDGVMRNPLSRSMFSKSDIKSILAHSLGKRLKPLQMAQNQLKKGVRPATIERINALGRMMLGFQEVDTAPIREAIDEFEGYIATIPEMEQKTINSLKIPAKDGTSGQPFDYTIGESVRDAKANVTCFHKVWPLTCSVKIIS